MSEIRQCPMPYSNAHPGSCRWCAKLIFKPDGRTVNFNRRWHEHCKTEFLIARGGFTQRFWVERRDDEICAACGWDCKIVGSIEVTRPAGVVTINPGRWSGADFGGPYCWVDFKGLCRPWQVDHIKPLWSLNSYERENKSWWLLGNLQTLCDPCHKEKTRQEAAQRARQHRERRMAEAGL